MLPLVSNANVYITECQQCTSDSQFQNAVVEFVDPARTNYVYVVNYSTSVIHKYRARVISTSIPGYADEPGVQNTFVQISRLSVEDSRRVKFENITSTLSILNDFDSLDISVPEEVTGSAYDLVLTSSTQHRVNTYIQNTLSTNQELTILFYSMADFFSGVVNASAPKLFVNVEYSDYSTEIYEILFDEDGLADRVTYKLVERRDSSGNLLPDDRDYYLENRFLFPPSIGNTQAERTDRFIEFLQEISINAFRSDAGSVPSDLDNFQTECTPNDEGGYTCRLINRPDTEQD